MCIFIALPVGIIYPLYSISYFDNNSAAFYFIVASVRFFFHMKSIIKLKFIKYNSLGLGILILYIIFKGAKLLLIGIKRKLE
jgi:hypothetical protein